MIICKPHLVINFITWFHANDVICFAIRKTTSRSSAVKEFIDKIGPPLLVLYKIFFIVNTFKKL